jgi:hypothetical protein
MKSGNQFSILLIIVTLLFTVSCRKNKEFKNETGQVAEDNSRVQSELDAAMNDVNKILSTNNGMKSAGVNNWADVCGAIVDSSQVSTGILILNFDGTTNCFNRTRTGQMILTLENFAGGTRWVDVNAVIKIQLVNYKITSVQNPNLTLTVNGTKRMKNISGGNAVRLVLGVQSSLVHDVNGENIIATFEDGTTATYNISRRFTHTFSNNVYQVKGEGIGSQNGLSGVEKWGTTRSGNTFTSQVTQPVIWNNTCGSHKPLSGVLEIKVEERDFSLISTFGVDQTGNPVNSGCPWGFKVEWERNGNTGNALKQYN